MLTVLVPPLVLSPGYVCSILVFTLAMCLCAFALSSHQCDLWVQYSIPPLLTPVFHSELTLFWASFRVFSSIQGILLRRLMRAFLIAVNNSIACQGARIEKQNQGQLQSGVLPAGPLRRALSPRSYQRRGKIFERESRK